MIECTELKNWILIYPYSSRNISEDFLGALQKVTNIYYIIKLL